MLYYYCIVLLQPHVKVKFELCNSHHIRSTDCWRPFALCRGPRRFECGVNWCFHLSGSLSLDQHQGPRFGRKARGTQPRSDGAARQSAGAQGAAAPPPTGRGQIAFKSLFREQKGLKSPLTQDYSVGPRAPIRCGPCFALVLLISLLLTTRWQQLVKFNLSILTEHPLVFT